MEKLKFSMQLKTLTFATKVTFLGHKLSNDKHAPDLEKILGIKRLKVVKRTYYKKKKKR